MIKSVKKALAGLLGTVGNTDLVKDYKEVFNTQAGERVLTDLMKFSKLVEPTFQPGDSHTSAYYEGMRRVGLRIFSFINNDLEKTKLLNQHNEEIND